MNREELKNLLIDQIFKYVFMHEEIARSLLKHSVIICIFIGSINQ
jgi:hypothetical protein